MENQQRETTMKAILAMLAIVSLASCTTMEKSATIGGVGGAVIGGAVSNSVGGALVGAAIGTVGGALIGTAAERGKCKYRDRYNRVYIARC
jgi:outer membrane lipoprotein SlyB